MDKRMLYLVIILPLFALMLMYYIQGPNWDLISYYLYGKSLTNPNFYAKNYTIVNDTLYNGQLYIEAFRSPFGAFVIAPLSLFLSNPVYLMLFYVTILYLLLLAALHSVSKGFGIDQLIVYSIFLNPFVIYFMFLYNSAEILSSLFILLALSYTAMGKPIAGLFLALANLSKYPSLIFLPLLLFLWDRRKILTAYAIWAIPTLVWMLCNYYFFGNPIFSYYKGATNEVLVITPGPYYLIALVSLLMYPVIFSAVSYLSTRFTKQKRIRFEYKLFDRTHLMLLSFIALSLIGYALIEPRFDAFQQTRLGFFISISITLLCVALISGASKKFKQAPIARNLASTSIILMLAFIYLYYASHLGGTAYYAINNPNSIYAQARSELGTLGIGNCRIVSNAWIYMRYLGIKAYATFYPNSTTYMYPTLSFNYTQLPPNFAANDTKYLYRGVNFSVLASKNYACYN